MGATNLMFQHGPSSTGKKLPAFTEARGSNSVVGVVAAE
jgi:hypothetical protein